MFTVTCCEFISPVYRGWTGKVISLEKKIGQTDNDWQKQRYLYVSHFAHRQI